MKFVLISIKQTNVMLILALFSLIIFYSITKSHAQTEVIFHDIQTNKQSINCNNLKYNGYVANWKSATAIINNEVYSIGDVINNTDLKVISISENKVTLQDKHYNCEIIHSDQANYKN